MNLLLKLIVFIVPTTFILLFFMILTNEDAVAIYSQISMTVINLAEIGISHNDINSGNIIDTNHTYYNYYLISLLIVDFFLHI